VIIFSEETEKMYREFENNEGKRNTKYAYIIYMFIILP
jgi:hypothetical protein